MTVKDMIEIVSFLEIAQRVSERGLRDSKEGSIYHDCMQDQLQRVTDLINRLKETRI